ncbi:DUF2812 domain-containing protein [Psychrobacillus glaciei]|uniref:DUF2812 domain-containing protein n=1 Tax=Psychrobacillus glaciei TaxID=2283160 RepID=A0A5J6SN40_9BACI|nr:DUF2812 domain-containing protein [Psychrobacillus glaciei]QFF99346.1 DUF2812 domain-containing protein [Psychrobacillus glaciei]
MFKKNVKWLWSYNIEKTEQWLTEMMKKGWHLTNANRLTRTSSFEQGKQNNMTYRIQYNPKNRSFPTRL